jgi:hypothetical protein
MGTFTVHGKCEAWLMGGGEGEGAAQLGFAGGPVHLSHWQRRIEGVLDLHSMVYLFCGDYGNFLPFLGKHQFCEIRIMHVLETIY